MTHAGNLLKVELKLFRLVGRRLHNCPDLDFRPFGKVADKGGLGCPYKIFLKGIRLFRESQHNHRLSINLLSTFDHTEFYDVLLTESRMDYFFKYFQQIHYFFLDFLEAFGALPALEALEAVLKSSSSTILLQPPSFSTRKRT